MKIAENIKCKDFSFKSRRLGSRLAGEENLWVCDIYYGGKRVGSARNKSEAKRWVSKKVKAVNAVLEAARKKYGEEI